MERLHINEAEQSISRFHEACIRCDLPAVNSHLKQGVNVNATDKDGLTALHHACRLGGVAIVQALLSYRGVKAVGSTEGTNTPSS